MDYITLYPTQEKAGQSILEELNRGEARLILLGGLSGVGKSLTLGLYKDRIEGNGGVILEPYHIIRTASCICDKGKLERTLIQDGKSIVVGVTPREMDLALETISTDFPHLNKTTHILQGLSLEEAVDYTHKVGEYKHTLIPKEKLAFYSMGVRSLVRVLMSDENISLEDVINLSASYLRMSSGLTEINIEKIDRYLQIQPPIEVLNLASRIDQYNIKILNLLPNILRRIEEFREGGLHMESPFFVAPESMYIYDITNYSIMDNEIFPRIDIFVPYLNHKDFESVRKEFGLPEDFGSLRSDEILDLIWDAPRLKAFGTLARKADIWVKYPNCQEYFGGEDEWARDSATEFEKEFNRNKFPIKSKIKEDSAETYRLYFHIHEHPGAFVTPLEVGWAMESLLQQRAIPYIARNFLLGKTYVFNPENKRIES